MFLLALTFIDLFETCTQNLLVERLRYLEVFGTKTNVGPMAHFMEKNYPFTDCQEQSYWFVTLMGC